MNNFNKLIFIALLIFGSIGNFAADAAIINAQSCSLADVQLAYNAASAGDIIEIPVGTCTWTSQLVINKSVTLRGQGISSTIINHGAAKALILVNATSDVPIRVTGIYFKSSTNNPGYSAILIQNWKSGLTKLRIDNNKIEKGTRGIYAAGWVSAVIDHNLFLNCNIAVYAEGSGSSWSRPIQAGTADTLFIENNLFTIDNNADMEPNEQIYHYAGARTVTRYNTFDGSQYTSGNSLFWESHGNLEYYTGTDYMRGQPIVEVYNNTFNAHHTYRFIYLRSGSSLIYNNTMTTVSGSATPIVLTEEESWQTSFFKPLRTTWPAEDQITNSFFWNNTYNGKIVTDAQLNFPSDKNFIQKDRDYFMHAPQASGGKATYPTRAGASDITFSSSGPNAYYPYTPYTYPHPLTLTQAEPAPPAPTPASALVPPPPPAPAPDVVAPPPVTKSWWRRLLRYLK